MRSFSHFLRELQKRMQLSVSTLVLLLMQVLLVQAVRMPMKITIPAFNVTLGGRVSNHELTPAEAKFLCNIDNDNKIAMNTLVKIIESKVGWKHVNVKDGYLFIYLLLYITKCTYVLT